MENTTEKIELIFQKGKGLKLYRETKLVTETYFFPFLS